MAIIPGVTGQKAELFDGAKIDAISEYTAGNGVQLQGRTNGVAIEAGKVGETLYDSGNNIISMYDVVGNWTTLADVSVTIGRGKWKITYSLGIQWGPGTGTATMVMKAGCVDSGNTELDLMISIPGYGIANAAAFSRQTNSFTYTNTTSDALVLRVAGYIAVATGTVSTAPVFYLRGDQAGLSFGKNWMLAERIA